MGGMHSLLKRQIIRHFGGMELIPPGCEGIINAINEAYFQMDLDREMIERSLELSSQELLQANSEMRAVFQAFPDQLFRTDRLGAILDYQVSPSADLHHSVEIAVGKKISEIFPKSVGEIYKNAFKKLGEINSLVSIDYSLLGKNNEYHYEARLLPLTESQIIILVRDITERKRAEENLVRLATIIEQAAEGIVVTGLNWIIQYANPAFERMSGYSRNEIIGHHARIHKTRKQDKLFRANIRSTLARGEVWSGRIINKKKDGTLYDVELMSSPILDNSGNITNHVCIFRDITHEVNLEGLLRQAQKMEAIGTLSGGIAHDFNNILGAIIGYTEAAQIDDRTENQKYYLEQVLYSCDRAKNLISQILTFSRQQEHERKPVFVAPIIKEVIKLLRPSLPSTIQITQNITKAATTILADPIQIHQVVMNLCTNAAHAMREKGGILDIRLIHEKIDPTKMHHCSTLNKGQYAKLVVSDTGHGIDPSIMDRIFDPFFTTKKLGEGTGLGLSVVYGIVKNHDGDIFVFSEPGKGTTISVYFPLIESEALIVKSSPELIPEGRERILFVDDETALVEVATLMLTSLGYSVTSKSSSTEALDTFRARPESFDLVITDMTMPTMTGIELAKEIIKIRPEIPVILCTGYSEIITEEKAKSLGVRQFIMKPLFKKDLSAAIRNALK